MNTNKNNKIHWMISGWKGGFGFYSRWCNSLRITRINPNYAL